MVYKTKREQQAEIEDLKNRLHEAEENLNAIRAGAVDALIVSGPEGEQGSTLNDADRPYRTIIEEMSEGTVITNAEGTILYCNKQFSRMLRVRLSKLIGSSLPDFVESQDRKTLKKLISRKKGRTAKAEIIFGRTDGTSIYTSVSFSSLSIDNVPAFYGVITDVTALKNTQKALLVSEERYRSILENMEEAYYEVDLKGNLKFFNTAAARLLGFSESEVMDRNYRSLMDEPNAKKVLETFHRVYLTGKPEKLFDWEFLSKSGEKITVEASVALNRDAQGIIIGFKGIIRNITDWIRAEEARKQFESQLMQIQKMEAMGRFAGGIAHDLNNILLPIIIDTEFLLEKISPDTNLFKTLNEILSAAYRQRDLVRQIISFSRGKEQQFMPIKITPLIKEALTFLKASLPSTVTIRERIDIAADVILGDSTQVHQIIMNLCKNAADSLEAQKGTIEVELGNVFLEPAFINPELEGGKYIRLSVKDSGCGIPAECMDKIFEPFFTTKESGKGSGMGLAIVHGIIKRHGGVISVKSEPGKGSCFDVYLPENYGVPVKTSSDKGIDRPLKGREKILLIDDEVIILSSLKRALEKTGYEIVAVHDGIEALKMFSRAPDTFDLVITDLTMPRISGVDVAKKIMSIRSDIPIILTSGHSDLIDEQAAKAMGIREMLMKPSTIKELNTIVRRTLES